jgi:hypothetical protein
VYFIYARTGGPVKTKEDDPLDPTPVRDLRESLAAIRQLISVRTPPRTAPEEDAATPPTAQSATARARCTG